MKQGRFLLIGFSVMAIASLALANANPQTHRTSKSTHAPAHVMVTPDEVKWGPAPPSLPAGAQLAVLEGDPSKPGVAFTIRGKFPDGYKVPPHWHPTDERVTVLEGSLGVGLGTKFDPAAGRVLTVGGYAAMPKGVRHFAWAVGETVIQVSGIGPFAVNYVNKADDPRNAK
jgi:quercetin dioxygenase-like cupin family protein